MNMNSNEPIRYHYIPQFILKNFVYDEGIGVHFFDVESNSIKNLRTKDVFMQRNLYRDEINHADFPTKLEADFSKFEQEVSKIVKKCLNDKVVTLSIKEYDSLFFFFVLMGLRSKITFDEAFNKIDDEGYYSIWQKDGNLTDFWKRNLEQLVNCRSYEAAMENQNIDDPIKKFLKRDAFGFFGKYITLMEKRGPVEFVISDAYPVSITGDILDMPMYFYFPISPDRIIVLCSNGVKDAPQSVRMFDKSNLKRPLLSSDKQNLEIKVNKIYEPTVSKINEDIIKHAKSGYIITENNFDFYNSDLVN